MPLPAASPLRARAGAAASLGCAFTLSAFGNVGARVELVSRPCVCNWTVPATRRKPAIARAAIRIRVIV